MKAFSDEIYLLIIFAGFIQGVLLSFGLARSRSLNKKSNQYLILFIIIVTLTLLARLTAIKEIFFLFPHLGLTADLMMLLYAPVLYFYVYSLFTKTNMPKMWLHFVPTFIQLLLWIPYYFISSEEILDYIMKSKFSLFPWFQAVGIIQIYIYSVVIFNIVKKYKNFENENLSFKQGIDYLSIIFGLILFANTAWLAGWVFYILKVTPTYTMISYNTIWLFLTFVVYTIGYFALKKPELIRFEFEQGKYQGSNLSVKRIDEIKLKIDKTMAYEKLYLNPKLTVGQLAEEIDENVKDVSRVLNDKFSMNFFDFVNSYRIAEFLKLANENKHKNMTLLSLAFDSGFNSKTTFNTAFKKIKNTSPTAFLSKK